MRRVSARHITLGLLLCGAIAYLAYAVKTASPPSSAKEGSAIASRTTHVAKADQGPLDLRLPEEVDFDRYQSMIARNIFAPPAPPKPPEPPKVLPLPTFQSEVKPPVSTPPPRPDLSGWTYVGYMVAGGRKIGVLQNEGNDRMEELSIGKEFLGAKVRDITSDEIVFTSPGGEVRLSVPRDFPVVSLSKTSAGTPSRPARPQPGPPSAPGPPSPPEGEE